MKTFITSFLVLFLISTGINGQISLKKDSLLAYYNFESNANNQLGNQFHLTGVNNGSSSSPTYTSGGKSGKAVSFNGFNALVNNSEFVQKIQNSTNKSLSISFWVNTPNSVNTYPTFVEVFESMFLRNTMSPEYGIATSANNGTGTASWTTGTSTNIGNTGWNHFTLVFDAPNKKFKVYKNGILLFDQATANNYIHLATQMFVVGAGTNSGSINYTVKGAPASSLIDEMYVYNRVLSANEISELSELIQLPASSVTNEKLLAYYPFESSYNNLKSNSYHLTATNSSTPTFSTGKAGNAVNFNGQQALWSTSEFGQYIAAASDKSLSVSLWVNRAITQGTQYPTIFELSESMFLRENLFLGIATNANTWLETQTTISNNSWQHIVAVYDSPSAQTRLYVNGRLKGTQNGINAFHRFNDIFVLGSGANNGSINSAKSFKGAVDEMYVFNRVLSGDEISGLTNGLNIVLTETSVRNTAITTLSIYPNPANDMINISGEYPIEKIEIYALSGALVQTINNLKQNAITVNLYNLNKGFYVIKTHTEKGIAINKLQIN